MKLISWNVNGLRAVLKKGFLEYLKAQDPDVICLQETKAHRDQVEIDLPNYEEFWNSAEKKGYSGTAIFSKTHPISIQNGIQFDGKIPSELGDEFGGQNANEGRVIAAEYESFYLVTVYTPNSKPKLARHEYRTKVWDALFLKYIKSLEKHKPVIFCGDLNVAHQEIDIARPDSNKKNAGFTDEERANFDKIINAGFVDTFRMFNQEGGNYTWWTHWANARERNIGWRIDYFCVSESLKGSVTKAEIHMDTMGSDHCPVLLEIDI